MKDEGQRETSEWGVDDFGAVALSGVGRTRRRRRRRRTTKPFAEIVV
jgi:hypothetical protein